MNGVSCVVCGGGGDECFAAREILYLCTSYNFVVFIILLRPSSLLQTPPADISLSLTPSASRLNLHPYHLSLCPPPSQSEHPLGVRGRSKPKQEKEDKKERRLLSIHDDPRRSRHTTIIPLLIRPLVVARLVSPDPSVPLLYTRGYTR